MKADENETTKRTTKMKLGTETGSLMNHFFTSGQQTAPEVGMGATVCMWSDRCAATIVKVTATQIHVQFDDATRTDNNGMSEDQSYDYARNETAPVEIFRKTKRGLKSTGGNGLLIGVRRAYHDFSF